ncbi:unnamed protein product [Trifolium pratense]|uniref:Uncharacterized protein n=1 Tax=Trifolium pratense TaxID=57577 RepID=A0ACB0LPF1_TRIPR|nr:unnamed protein product [Trifolium pratense]
MLNNNPNISSSHVSHENQEDEQITEIREIHALTPPRLPPPPQPQTNRGSGSSHSHRSSSLSTTSTDSENFTTISREFNALVLAGSTIDHNNISPHEYETSNNNNLGRIREDDHMMEETNPLAIVVDNNPLDPIPSSASRRNIDGGGRTRVGGQGGSEEHASVDRVKKEEVDAKISAWQNAKVAKINNRFKREDAVINGWESEQVQKATSWMKKIEFLLIMNHKNCAEKAGGEKSKSIGENTKQGSKSS